MVASPITTDRPLTIDDLDAMPDDGQRYELILGELIVSPAPGGTHQAILGELFVLLRAAARRDHLGRVLLAPYAIKLSENDLVEPDLIFFRDAQSAQYSERYFDGAPAFVIEIVSPSSGAYDRVRKAALYMNAGVEEYWVVEPQRCRILIHDRAQGEPSPRIVTDGAVSSRIVPGFEVDLETLFSDQA